MPQFPRGSSYPDYSDEIYYENCGNLFKCGDISNVGYPFRNYNDPPYCGYPGFELSCNEGNTTIDIMNETYRVLEINQSSKTMKIVREDIMEGNCPQEFNTTLDNSLFEYTTTYINLTFLYDCHGGINNIPGIATIPCGDSNDAYVLPAGAGASVNCSSSVIVPVPVVGAGYGGFPDSTLLMKRLKEGQEIRWKMDSKACDDCTKSEGSLYPSSLSCISRYASLEIIQCKLTSYCGLAPLALCEFNTSSVYEACAESFSCGDIDAIGYPFWGGTQPAYCGHPKFELSCNNESPPEITILEVKYKVVNINYETETASIVRDDLLSNICPSNPRNASLDFNLFSYDGNQNITLFYGCTIRNSLLIPNYLFNCSEDANLNVLWSTSTRLPNIPGISNIYDIIQCGIEIFVTVTQEAFEALITASLVTEELVRQSIGRGFSVDWKADNSLCDECTSSGGRCGSNGDPNSPQFICYIDNSSSNKTPLLAIGLGIAGAVLAGVGIGWLIFRHKRKRVAAKALEHGQASGSSIENLPTLAVKLNIQSPLSFLNSKQTTTACLPSSSISTPIKFRASQIAIQLTSQRNMDFNPICPALFMFILLIQTPVTLCQNNGSSSEYEVCGEPFSCTNIENVGYPFWGGIRPAYCGHPSFELDCSKDSPEITIQSVKYRVVNISNRAQTATIARDDLTTNICPSNPRNASLDFNLFSYVSSGDNNISLFYGCTIITTPVSLVSNLFNCSEANSNSTGNGLWLPSTTGLPNNNIKCGFEIFVTVSQEAFEALGNASLASEELLRTSVGGGFPVEWKANNSLCLECTSSGGRCGSNGNFNSTQFVCYYARSSSNSKRRSLGKVLGIVGAILGGIFMGWLYIVLKHLDDDDHICSMRIVGGDRQGAVLITMEKNRMQTAVTELVTRRQLFRYLTRGP
nr:LEAF RUST 10 DISEASE-RESISTANCE LOCUS RECEPTOR-LIKE PROTEIN KINASE-like 2.1 [Ipomoea batatas]